MLLVGLAFVVFAALLQFSTLSVIASAFLVGLGLVVFALLSGERNLR
jgi:hypothetical protein